MVVRCNVSSLFKKLLVQHSRSYVNVWSSYGIYSTHCFCLYACVCVCVCVTNTVPVYTCGISMSL